VRWERARDQDAVVFVRGSSTCAACSRARDVNGAILALDLENMFAIMQSKAVEKPILKLCVPRLSVALQLLQRSEARSAAMSFVLFSASRMALGVRLNSANKAAERNNWFTTPMAPWQA
jgi:hypothetical protein